MAGKNINIRCTLLVKVEEERGLYLRATIKIGCIRGEYIHRLFVHTGITISLTNNIESNISKLVAFDIHPRFNG